MKRNKYRFEGLLRRKEFTRLTVALLRKLNSEMILTESLDGLDVLFALS